MDKNYWKNAYKNSWSLSSKREIELSKIVEEKTEKKILVNGLGATSDEFFTGSAKDNGFEKGEPDLLVENTNIYLEVTGPLSNSVGPDKPLWFRPDKIENARNHLYDHDTFLVHNCPASNLWRVIHLDTDFFQSFKQSPYQIVTPLINRRKEKYIEIPSNDAHIKSLSYLLDYIKQKNNFEMICPKCGSKLVKRIASKGYRKGKAFWGCSSFPNCDYINNID